MAKKRTGFEALGAAVKDPTGAARGDYGKNYQGLQKGIDYFDLFGYQKKVKKEAAAKQFDENAPALTAEVNALPQYQSVIDTKGGLGQYETAGLAGNTSTDLAAQLANIKQIQNADQYGGYNTATGGLGRSAIDIQRLRTLGTGTLQGIAGEQLDAAKLRAAQQRQALGGQLARSASGQRSALAASGGLSGGARDRLAVKLGRQSLIENQNLGSQQALTEADILSGASGRRLNILGGLSGQEQALAAGNLGTAQFQRQGDVLQAEAGRANANALQEAQVGDINRSLQARQFDVGNTLAEKRLVSQAEQDRAKLRLQTLLSQQLGRQQLQAS